MRIVFALIAFILFCSHATAQDSVSVDRILVLKSERKMYLQYKGENIREYDIALGFSPVGHKEKQGDGKTPEGIYKISGRNPKSQYHKSLRVSYPNSDDRKRAKAMGADPGGDIMIHGLPNNMGFIGGAHTMRDWTWGCIAVTSDEVDEIWNLVKNGTVIEIKP